MLNLREARIGQIAVVCKDVAAHDAYQVDPIHHAFIDQFKSFWNRVQIYDAE